MPDGAQVVQAAQDLRQLTCGELARSPGAVGKRGQANALLGHGHLLSHRFGDLSRTAESTGVFQGSIRSAAGTDCPHIVTIPAPGYAHRSVP